MAIKAQPKQPEHRTIQQVLEQDYLTMEQACERMKVSRWTILRRRKEKSLTGKFYGKRIWISIKSIEAYEENFEKGLPEFAR